MRRLFKVRVYKHWLKIDGKLMDTTKQWNNVKEYLEKYQDSKAKVYLREYGFMFDRFVCLETTQSYDELDLDCNSFSRGSLIRLERKPQGLESKGIEFQKSYEIHTRKIS
jgi:hypothetical protein